MSFSDGPRGIKKFEPQLIQLPPSSCAGGASPGGATEAYCFANALPGQPTQAVISELPPSATLSFNDAAVFTLLTGQRLPGLVLSSPYDPSTANPACNSAWAQANVCRSNIGLVPADQVGDIQKFCSQPNAPCYPCANGSQPVVPPSHSTISFNGSDWVPYICPLENTDRPVLLHNLIAVGESQLSTQEGQPKNSDLRYRIDRVGDGKWFEQSTVPPSILVGPNPRPQANFTDKTLVEKGLLTPGQSKLVNLRLGDVLSACSVVTVNCRAFPGTTQVNRLCNDGRQFINMSRDPPDTSCTYWGLLPSQINLRDYSLGVIAAHGTFGCPPTGKVVVKCSDFEVNAYRFGFPGGPPSDAQPHTKPPAGTATPGCEPCSVNSQNFQSPPLRNNCWWPNTCLNLFPS